MLFVVVLSHLCAWNFTFISLTHSSGYIAHNPSHSLSTFSSSHWLTLLSQSTHSLCLSHSIIGILSKLEIISILTIFTFFSTTNSLRESEFFLCHSFHHLSNVSYVSLLFLLVSPYLAPFICIPFYISLFLSVSLYRFSFLYFSLNDSVLYSYYGLHNCLIISDLFNFSRIANNFYFHTQFTSALLSVPNHGPISFGSCHFTSPS